MARRKKAEQTAEELSKAERKRQYASEYYRRNRERILAYLRKRYHEDPEYRERVKKRALERYHNDPEYRRKTIERAKQRYYRMREALMILERQRAEEEARKKKEQEAKKKAKAKSSSKQ